MWYPQRHVAGEDNVHVTTNGGASGPHIKAFGTSYETPLAPSHHLSKEVANNLGGAWLRIGTLRYHLLQCCDDVDPAVKKNLKYTKLNKRIVLLELEIEERRIYVYLSGCFSTESDKEKIDSLNNLKADRNRLQRQVVFRSDNRKYKKLRSECDEFLKLVATPFDLLRNMANLDIQQETATRFVDRLSYEYSEYVDILQPVQIAIYQMKLGLSFMLSSCMRNQYLDRVGQKNIDVILGAVYSFIRFPRGIAAKDNSCIEENLHDKLSYFDKYFPTYMGQDEMNMVETLVTSTRDNNVNEGPTLDEFLKLLKDFGGLLDKWLSDHITERLSLLSSPDDLFSFFSELRGILAGPETSFVEDDQINLNPISTLGMYLRRCLLAFNHMSFEVSSFVQLLIK
ncbi:hypothetical protein Tco_0969774 [Tanacetum coccineum]